MVASAMVICSSTAWAQTASEGLRYSRFDVLGTARSVATAGSMSALGGDFSVLNLNPAGAAAYRGSEFTLTPGYFRNTTDASLRGADAPALSRVADQVLLADLGFVLAARPRRIRWKTSNFAIGFTKVADYHEMFEYSGSSPGSITDRYRQQAQDKAPDDLMGEAALAFNAGAIYDFDENLTYESDYQLADATDLLRRQTFESSGYNTELLFAYGANYDEKILFGFAIGVPILSYEETKIYREDDRNNSVPYFNALKYEETISTSGSGFNVKAGVIFKIGKWVNLGLAYHSPTRYALTDNFNSSLEYDYTDMDNDGPLLAESPDGSFRYNLRTPQTLSGGAGVVIAKSGFLSAEVQYKDYSGAKFNYTGRGNGISFSDEEDAVNATIREELSDALTIRIGAEVAIQKFRVRGGLELDQRPYANDTDFDPTYNGGIGFRGDNFFIDLAYQRNSQNEGFLPYQVSSGTQPFVEKQIDRNRVVLTLAYRWQ